MQDPPSSERILDLAIDRLRTEAQPLGKFELRMIIAALELVRRAVALAPHSEGKERQRLCTLLGETGDLERLNRRLCASIRDGVTALSSTELMTHLRATAMEKLEIDQPTYSAFRRAVERPNR